MNIREMFEDTKNKLKVTDEENKEKWIKHILEKQAYLQNIVSCNRRHHIPVSDEVYKELSMFNFIIEEFDKFKKLSIENLDKEKNINDLSEKIIKQEKVIKFLKFKKWELEAEKDAKILYCTNCLKQEKTIDKMAEYIKDSCYITNEINNFIIKNKTTLNYNEVNEIKEYFTKLVEE